MPGLVLHIACLGDIHKSFYADFVSVLKHKEPTGA